MFKGNSIFLSVILSLSILSSSLVLSPPTISAADHGAIPINITKDQKGILPVIWAIAAIVTAGATTYTVYTVHERNSEMAERRAQDCKDAGGVPEVKNTFPGIGFDVKCKIPQ
ncbi:hypothetical protein NW801_19590 [Brevibacillus laterosporus]|uniref:Uncharacterized protein n=1 Tax=Brevibacillus halotolerans TaxID=1507437 RepID=A0ABT4I1K6_9BACL|nr:MULTISPECIES: hypothetical protein [Brevibacillus]MCR8987211.1 hypothetical protein [Brevibacillus laterosporus]MCZ0832948.1 hypothetical protein [Brevibacillus halotolerans]